jgi:hypothetical protein
MKNLFFVLAVASTIVSCKKSSPAENTCTVNATSIAGTYTISSIKYKASSSAAETDLFTDMPDCQKDDTYELKSDGSLAISEAANDCGLPPLPGSPSDWSLANDNKVLVMGANLDIVSFNCSKLVVAEKNTMVDGDIKTTTYDKK